MAKIAKRDAVVHDEALDSDVKVFAGTRVPPHLEDAKGVSVADEEDEAPERRGLATKDTEVEYEGLTYKVFAGQPVPVHLRGAYNDKVGKKDALKAQAGPDVDGVQDAPEVHKAQTAPETRKASRRAE